jgi:hypothetical protein
VTEYERHDDRDMPGWTLLLPAVVKAYGVCPYLDVNIPHHGEERARWIAVQADGGAVYHNEVGRLVSSEDRERHRVWEAEALSKLEAITCRLGSRHGVDVASIMEAVRRERDNRAKTKKDKARFLGVMQELDHAAREAHVDLVTYMDVVERWNIRHTLPEDVEIDQSFTEVCDEIRTERGKLNNITGERGRQKKQAYDSLSGLIDDNFRLAQQGRWCKRWFQLTPEQKEERVSAYASGWATSRGLEAGVGRRFAAFVREVLGTKLLTTTGIRWNIQAGVIEGIDVSYDQAEDTFSVEKGGLSKGKSEKRKVKPVAGRQPAVSDHPRTTKAHRLMLLFLTSSDIVEKEAAVGYVSMQMGPEHSYPQDALGSLFEKMADIIAENPM